MPAWAALIDGGKTYDLSHLDPFHLDVDIDGRTIEVAIDFGHHAFSDKTGKGFRIQRTNRFFCPHRYASSFTAADFMRRDFHDCHLRAYLNYEKDQQFYTTDAGGIAVFMAIQVPPNTVNRLKCHVVSAYDPTWGRFSLPKSGKLYRAKTVLQRKVEGIAIQTFK